MNTIPVLEWRRKRNTGDLVAWAGMTQLRIQTAGRAGFELWAVSRDEEERDKRRHEYLGWFAHEDEAQDKAAEWVGDK